MIRVAPFSGTAETWDTFGATAPGWTHFHRAGWLDVFERALGHECLRAAAHAPDGRLVGVLPLVRVRSRLFGHFLVSVPFVNYGGPVGEPDAVRALAAWAVERAATSGAGLLELRSRVELPVDLPVSHRKVTVVLPLPDRVETLWDGLKAKVRSQVRRPQKEDVTVRFGADQLEPFHAVFAHHMRDLGTPAHGRRLFAELVAAFPESAWVGTAWHRGRPVAAGMGFHWGDEFEMTWASSLRAANPIAPNMLLYWAFMERAIGTGVRRFNFGRCTPGSGTHRFKKQWGGEDETLWWYQHGAGKATGTPSPDDGKWSWGPRVWRRLPLPVASWLGPRIVRLIP